MRTFLRSLLVLLLATSLLSGCGDDGGSADVDERAASTTVARPAPGSTADPCERSGCGPGATAVPPGTEPPTPSTLGSTTTTTAELLAPTSEPVAAVVPGSLRVVADDDRWKALGLVQSQLATPLAGVVVGVELLDGDGNVIGGGQTTAPVRPVGPGSSVPFELEVGVPGAAVAEVRWRTAGLAGSVGGAPVEPQVFWTRAADDPRPVDMPLHRDVVGAPRAHVVFGSVTATGAASVPGVVGAWIASDGRVVAVAQSPVYEPASERPAASIAAGSSGDFLLAVDGADASALAAAELRLWPTTRW